MGSPPPPNFPPPPSAGASATIGVSVPSAPAATICGFGIGLPRLKFGISIFLGGLSFPPSIPLPWFVFKLTCNLKDPIDCSGGLGFGGGREPNAEPDPDLREDDA